MVVVLSAALPSVASITLSAPPHQSDRILVRLACQRLWTAGCRYQQELPVHSAVDLSAYVTWDEWQRTIARVNAALQWSSACRLARLAALGLTAIVALMLAATVTAAALDEKLDFSRSWSSELQLVMGAAALCLWCVTSRCSSRSWARARAVITEEDKYYCSTTLPRTRRQCSWRRDGCDLLLTAADSSRAHGLPQSVRSCDYNVCIRRWSIGSSTSSVTYALIDATRTASFILSQLAIKAPLDSLQLEFCCGQFTLEQPVDALDQSYVVIVGSGGGFRSGVDRPPPGAAYGGVTVFTLPPAVPYAFSFSRSAGAGRISGIHLSRFSVSSVVGQRAAVMQSGILFCNDNDGCEVSDVTVAGLSGVALYNLAGDAFRVSQCQLNEVGSAIVLDWCLRSTVTGCCLGAQPVQRPFTTPNRSAAYPAGFNGVLGKTVWIGNCDFAVVSSCQIYPNGWTSLHVLNSYYVSIAGNIVGSFYIGAVMLQSSAFVSLTGNIIKVPGDRRTVTDFTHARDDVVRRAVSFGVCWCSGLSDSSIMNNTLYAAPQVTTLLNLSGGNTNVQVACNTLAGTLRAGAINVEGSGNSGCTVSSSCNSTQYTDSSTDQSTTFSPR